jgi:signal transduction histidine kinase
MNPHLSTLIGASAVLALLLAALIVAFFRLRAAARRSLRAGDQGHAAFVAAAMQDAVARLKEEQRATTARAEESERLSSEIIASMTSGLLVVTAAGGIRTLNPAGRRLLRLRGPQPASYRELLASAGKLADAIDECLETGEPIIRRTIDLRTAGVQQPEVTHLGVTVSPIGSSTGDLQGAICLFTDLTAVADLEEQLRLRESLSALGELTAGMAHEFRNGLATIHGYARLLDPDRLPPASRPFVEGIRHETVALGEIVTNFLNFARPAPLILAAVDLGILVERAADEIRPESRARGGDVRVRGHFVTIDGDEILLRQAFSNLCRNAFEACGESARVPYIEITGEVDRAHGLLRVTVSDNGPGLDPSLGDRIFRPFFTTRPKGTGLGLALVQKIVVTHGGRVTAGASARGGAAFQVVLPLGTARPAGGPLQAGPDA